MDYEGVIEKLTGDLLRCGYCDFEHDGEFHPETEEIRLDCPNPGYTRNGSFFDPQFHRWTGTEWILVDKPT